MNVDYKTTLQSALSRGFSLNRILRTSFTRFFIVQKSRVVIAFLLASIIYHVYFYNVWEYINSTPFVYFSYPLDTDMEAVVQKVLSQQSAPVAPLNNKRAFPYVLNADKRCKDDDGNEEAVFVIMLIKSRLENVERRRMIRRSWAREFGVASVPIRRVFLLGVHATDKKTQHRIGLEQQDFGDIVQQFFEDSYFNNTLKLIMGFQWTMEYCSHARFMAFFDDDYFVNVNNMVTALKSVKPTEYSNTLIGHVWYNAIPFRIKGSQWYIPLHEYPFRFFPPYVGAGAFFLPTITGERLYIAMQYTKAIRFEDVFLGIAAWKLKIRLIHNPNLYFYYLPYDVFKYRKVIASSGFDEEEFLYKVWKEQSQLDVNVAGFNA